MPHGSRPAQEVEIQPARLQMPEPRQAAIFRCLSGASGKLVEIFRAADGLRDNEVTPRDSNHDHPRPGSQP
jgi:hypothetical protein